MFESHTSNFYTFEKYVSSNHYTSLFGNSEINKLFCDCNKAGDL